MKKQSDFALVPRPPGAVEKASPSAGRILAGMVTDTLVLVKKVNRKSLRIVVLDDEEGPRRACLAMLKKIGYVGQGVMEFKDANDAWRELLDFDPDLFITDIQHVGISCKEMLTKLAARRINYPILVVSAVLGVYQDHGEPVWVGDVLRDWRPNLNVSFLPKPWTPKEFLTAFEAALRITV